MSQRKADTKAEAAALDDLLSANGLFPADVKAYIDPALVSRARQYVREGTGLGAARLAQLQEGLAKLQAAGVLEGIKAAKVQHAQAESQPLQRKTDTKAAVSALADLLSANGLFPVDVKGYIDTPLVYQARQYVKDGLGLPAAKLAKLQEGLAKLQAEGALEGLKTAKEQHKQAHSQLKADTAAAVSALDDLLSANVLVRADVKGYIDSKLVYDARQCAREGRGLPAARLATLQEGLAKLQAQGVLEGLKAAKAKAKSSAVERRQAAKPPPIKRRRTSSNGELAGGGASGSASEGGLLPGGVNWPEDLQKQIAEAEADLQKLENKREKQRVQARVRQQKKRSKDRQKIADEQGRAAGGGAARTSTSDEQVAGGGGGGGGDSSGGGEAMGLDDRFQFGVDDQAADL
jgi:hypothetical protein